MHKIVVMYIIFTICFNVYIYINISMFHFIYILYKNYGVYILYKNILHIIYVMYIVRFYLCITSAHVL